MRCLIVHNSRSGFGSSAIYEFERALLSGGDECVLRLLADNQRADEAVVDAEEFDFVVVSGGDGTTTSLLYALRNRKVIVCVFPSGTANLFCVNLNTAAEPSALARACRIGRTAQTDLGELTFVDEQGVAHTRGFSIMMGTGYDAQIMQAAVEGKSTFGEAAYFAAAIANVRPELHHFKITVDGKTFEREGISCLIANNSTLQGDVRIVPDGRMDDGLLEVIVLEQSSPVGLLRPIVASLVDKEGHNLGRPAIEIFRGKHICVELAKPAPLQYDGETFDGKVMSYEARVLPQANRVIVDGLSSYHDYNDTHSEDNPRFGEAIAPSYPVPLHASLLHRP